MIEHTSLISAPGSEYFKRLVVAQGVPCTPRLVDAPDKADRVPVVIREGPHFVMEKPLSFAPDREAHVESFKRDKVRQQPKRRADTRVPKQCLDLPQNRNVERSPQIETLLNC